MDINLLALNSGNSRLAIGAFIAGEMRPVVRIPNTQQDQWPAAIQLAWQEVQDKENAAIAGSSSHPALMHAVQSAAAAATGEKIAWVGKDLDLPVKVLTDQPNETGVDRILNIAAAYEQMGKACVVVDAGTALTISVCNDAGEFLGGAIAPGAGLLLSCLHERIPHLPLVELDTPAAPYGKNTRQAILHGVFYGIRGMVKEIIENYATDLGTWPDLIATGGDAAKLFQGWELVHAISPDLTLYGIALAYAEHHIKHED